MRVRTLDKIPDSILSFGRDSYLFITKNWGRYQLDFFQTWFVPRHAICLHDGEAANTSTTEVALRTPKSRRFDLKNPYSIGVTCMAWITYRSRICGSARQNSTAPPNSGTSSGQCGCHRLEAVHER